MLYSNKGYFAHRSISSVLAQGEQNILVIFSPWLQSFQLPQTQQHAQRAVAHLFSSLEGPEKQNLIISSAFFIFIYQ